MQHFFVKRICAIFILFLRVKLFCRLGVCDQWTTMRDIIVFFSLDIREPDFAANFYSDLVGFLYGQKHR